MKIIYKGVKLDGETAFKDETRITWYPGDVNEIEPGVAAKMLKHPDIFVRVGTPEAEQGAQAAAALLTSAAAQGWKDAAMAKGMTDGNIEAIESHGGPETEKGAALWLHYCGKPYENAPAPVTLAAAAPAAAGNSTLGTKAAESAVLPDWAKRGIELGATDDQLEAVAAAGGPETEAGAVVWRDATGTDWVAKTVVATPPGAPSADPLAGIDTMEAPALHELAAKLGVKVHHAAGAKKVRDALVAFQKAAAKKAK